VILGRFVLDPALNIGQFLMLIRVIMSWFPEVKINKMPWLLATFPTEGVLRATRGVIPPAFGVDISPVIWIAVLSFFREILFGQQGLFNIGAFD
jgi:YggT family protein